MTIEPGIVINDRYEIRQRIGRGGMASVWEADDRVLGRTVAVKILSDRYASDPDFVERFRREASAAAKLSHPNIVAVFDRGEFEGNYYIVMEYLPGPDLKGIIREQGPLNPRNAVDAALQILAALAAAHKRDVIHRDVKPQNVMVAEDGRLKVTDFGIARAGDEVEMTAAGSVIGTAQYLSPEQARGNDVTTASDCYSVGIVLYEMLTGRVPFDGDTPVAVAMRQVNEPPVAPRLLVPAIPDDLNDVVMHALEKRPGARYRTAEEFTDALLAVRDRLPASDQRTAILAPIDTPTRVLPSSPPPRSAETGATRRVAPAERRSVPPPPPPPEPPAKKRRGALIALIVILALALAGGAVAFVLGMRDDGVRIPDVTDQPAAQARTALEAEDFVVRETKDFDPMIVEGNVIETEPGADVTADRGSEVVMVVSRGKQMKDVPDVTGLTWTDAQAELTAAGFVPKRDDENNIDVPKDTVISQDPAAETSHPVNGDVTVTVSLGPKQVTVPDLSLDAQSAAEAELRGLNLTPKVEYRESEVRDPGVVIGQDPARNTTVDEGSTVTIVVSTAPTPTEPTTPVVPDDEPAPSNDGTVEVPDLVGSTAQDATAKVTAMGLPAPVADAVPSDEPEGTVVGQTPAEGTMIDPETQRITLQVSDGSGLGPSGSVPPGKGLRSSSRPDKDRARSQRSPRAADRAAKSSP